MIYRGVDIVAIMKLSTRSTYGLRFMFELACCYCLNSGPAFLKDIAQKQSISEKYLSKLMIPLKASGLVNSYRGARGGYELARHPSTITMRDIVYIMEGGVEVVDCAEENNKLNTSGQKATLDVWNKLNDQIAHTLNEITLESLVKNFLRQKDGTIMYHI